MYFPSGMEGFKKSEGRSTRGASSLQYWLRPPPQNWMRPYDSCSSAPTALMKKLSTANLLSIHVLILRIFVFGGATRIVGAGSRQSQIGLCTGVLLANPLPGASGLGKLTKITQPGESESRSGRVVTKQTLEASDALLSRRRRQGPGGPSILTSSPERRR